VPVLVELVKDPEGKNRRLAAQGLKVVGPDARSAIPALIEALADGDPKVRIVVEAALNAIDPEVADGAGVRWEHSCAPPLWGQRALLAIWADVE
jgi:HEAT repeat protein